MERTPLPKLFCETMREMLSPVEAERLFASLDGESPTAVRHNPYKCADVKPAGEEIAWSRYGRYLDERPQFTLDTDFAGGAYYVQEPGSQFVDHILREQHVEQGRILDMCAAPGGKTTIYSTAVGEDGLVVANEYVRNRAVILADNVRKWGLGNVVVTNNDPSHLAAFRGWFDVVAVDAPCSGEGMFRKDDGARAEWSAEGVRMCATRQMSILDEAWQTLRAGGVLIYSTCTFNRTENEGVVAQMMERYGDEIVEAEPIHTSEEWGVECGRVGAFQTFRFYPHRVQSEGFFVAVARKATDSGCARVTPRPRKRIMTDAVKADVAELARWVKAPKQMHFAMVGDTLYGYAAERYDEVRALAESLTVIYSGVAMGQIFKGRLKPDWALSQYVGLRREAVACVEVSKEEALDYLRKRDISATQFDEGLNLVVHNGVALGFVKRIGARCNNMYPLSLRITNL